MKRIFRVMVVEDSETQAFKMRLLLEDEGCEVSTVATAESALSELSQSAPDLVLIDYYLPGMLGDELCRRIRANLNTRGIQILMLTAAEAGETRGLESGADDYLSKSAKSDILLQRIRALLRKVRAQGAVDFDFRRARIMAIDDSPTHLEFLREELRSQGYEVETAASGPEGLERLARQSFDCVLVDLIMSDMDGIEVCRRISGMRTNLEKPVGVIMLTSSDTKEDMTRSLEAGADDFVCKSGDSAILRARIQALLRRRFFEEENRRIVDELKTKEVETLRANAGREAAESRAAMADELVHANRGLEEANRKLKETHAQLIQTEKMASLGQLVAGLAHEINNPLAFVVNNLYTVETGLDVIAAEAEPHLSQASLAKMRKVRTRLREMGGGLDRMKELVVHLRTFSRLDECEFKTVDIADSIDSVLVLLNHRLNRRIQVEKHYGPGRLLSCYAGRLNQVFMNLIANAMDAIPGKGTIVITTSQTDDTFSISVRDTGKGIPEAIRGRIFDPFFTDKPVGKGTGLGLAISYGIVQDHHGSIEVQSQEGAGSEFNVRIPRNLDSRRTGVSEQAAPGNSQIES
jgi:two-component system NtrC family sensor kinase